MAAVPAAAAAIFAHLVTTIAHVPAPIRQHVEAQGVRRVEDFLDLRDKGVTDMCGRMINPGGTLPGQGAAAGRANRGIGVTFTQQMNLR